ncbi:Kinesin-like protein KIF16B [Papilio machaon]|uniref:Kinesin-like protein KIF16B n=1 Tax=Papilio machaon TaxID=76193 RepID=A0A194RL36_PAPMA|nr:Kinesin-like protein KIF16B [Papilio machaon]
MAKVKLAIRIRPFTDKELKSDIDRTAVVCVSGVKTVTITNIKVNTSGAGDSRERVRPYYADFTFDSSCHKTNDEYATQEKVFETIGEGVLASMSQGLSACVLAYGQSATGKTYTMMGTESNPGLIPRLCRALGDEQPVDINVSFLEIYNERVHDLLAGDVIPAVDTFGSLPRRKGNARKDLRVREHPTKGPYVQNLRRVCVRDVGVLLSLVCEGARRRRTAATRRNPASSRSHALLQLTTPRATLHLADLAGSEKASWEGCGGGRQKEGANINKSLVALSNVISALVNGGSGRSKFVPYRDSALTWLLKDCFTGGGSIFIIATVSPSYACYGESASTLRWAAQARRLQTPKPAPVAGVTTRIALQAQLNQLLSELSRHHIRYIPESGKILYDDDHWKLNNNDKLKKEAKIGNIMNTTHPKTDAPNSESTNSLAVSGSSDVMNNLDIKTKVDNEIHKEVDKFFGPMLERTQSGSILDITPLRHKKRQYCSEEVLPVDECLNDKNNEKLPDFSQNHNETKKEEMKLAIEHKNSPVSILYDNQRAEIIASVTERLYSKFKKDAAANKMDATGDKKTMPHLSELKICSNARQRLLELSQKAIRNKKRIGIPAHTQTRRVVIRVKDQGINAQTDLAPFIILKKDTKIFYKDAATETIPLTPRCKDVASGDGSLNFDDKSTTMEIIKIAKKHSNIMTDIILKRNMCTQTQILPHSRRRKRASACTKLHKNRKSSKQTKDSCIIPSVININISPVCSFDSDSLNSSEKSDNECTQNKSENLNATPDLLASYNTDILEEVKVNDTELTNAEKACSVKDEIVSTSEVFDNITLEDFPDEELPLPRVTVDTTRVYDDNDIKNLILGRDVNAYPYNIALSPNKNKDVKRVIKFKDSKSCNFTTYNEYDKTNLKKDNFNRNHLLDPYSDTSDSTRLESESFVWNKGNIRDISVHKNQPNYDIKDGKIFNHCFDSETELELDIKRSSVPEKNNISKKGKYWTWQSGNKSNRLMKERDAKYKDNFCNIQNKIIETCSGLENAASEYEKYLNRYYGDHPNKSPTEYLHYLVNLRREVVRESLSTCSTDTISSDGHDASTL